VARLAHGKLKRRWRRREAIFWARPPSMTVEGMAEVTGWLAASVNVYTLPDLCGPGQFQSRSADYRQDCRRGRVLSSGKRGHPWHLGSRPRRGYPYREAHIGVSGVGGKKGLGSGPLEQEGDPWSEKGIPLLVKSWASRSRGPLLARSWASRSRGPLLARGGPSRSGVWVLRCAILAQFVAKAIRALMLNTPCPRVRVVRSPRDPLEETEMLLSSLRREQSNVGHPNSNGCQTDLRGVNRI
jgi:hypothetical protein